MAGGDCPTWSEASKNLGQSACRQATLLPHGAGCQEAEFPGPCQQVWVRFPVALLKPEGRRSCRVGQT